MAILEFISELIEKDEKGEYYLLNNPLETVYGELKIVKLRIFDQIKESLGSMDFKCDEYNSIREPYNGCGTWYSFCKSREF